MTDLRAPARWALRTTGRLTAGARVLPSFLIVGGQRCGTTSLHRALVQHPGIVGPMRRKGMRFFDIHYGQGMAWYRGHFPFASRARGAMAFEATPYYMFHPLAASRIAADLPGVKLIAMLRDPVERAYSAYTHEFERGFEAVAPFEKAVELEPSRLAGEEEKLVSVPGYRSMVHQHNAYLGRGRYIEQLERLEAAVGRERLHVVDSAEFFAAPEKVFGSVLDFLGLPRDVPISHERHNARPRSPMSETFRASLEEHFAPYDERLAAWLGEVPSWRR